jgi:hypothetical protein
MPGDSDRQAIQAAAHGGHLPVAAVTAMSVRCSDCRREIVSAAALNPESGAHALYFCGRGCFRQWLTTHEWNMGRRR